MANFWWTVFFWTGICMYIFIQIDANNPSKKVKRKRQRKRK